jgi:hypothetical protein
MVGIADLQAFLRGFWEKCVFCDGVLMVESWWIRGETWWICGAFSATKNTPLF